MALGSFTKKLATQAIEEQMNNVLDTLRPGDTSKPAEPAKPESLGAQIVAEIQAMQKALKDDQQLAVTVSAGPETLRVNDIYLPSGQLLVLTGVDADRNVTRLISAPESLQLVCKVVKAAADTKPARINFITPK